MSTLRWILLIAGIVIIVWVYFSGRFRNQKKPQPLRNKPGRSSEPQLDALSGSETIHDEHVILDNEIPPPGEKDELDLEICDLADLIKEAITDRSADQIINTQSEVESSGDEVQETETLVSPSLLINNNIVVINLISQDSSAGITGTKLLDAFNDFNIRYGEKKIFHCNQDGSLLFSLANIVEPGTFEPEGMHQFVTPGISLFMQLNEQQNPVKSFERMLEIVWELTNRLDTYICDFKRSTLTPEKAALLLDEIKTYAMR